MTAIKLTEKAAGVMTDINVYGQDFNRNSRRCHAPAVIMFWE